MVIPLGVATAALVAIVGGAIGIVGFLLRESAQRAVTEQKIDGLVTQIAPLLGLISSSSAHGTRLDNVDARLGSHSGRMDRHDQSVAGMDTRLGDLERAQAELRVRVEHVERPRRA